MKFPRSRSRMNQASRSRTRVMVAPGICRASFFGGFEAFNDRIWLWLVLPILVPVFLGLVAAGAAVSQGSAPRSWRET